MVLRATTPFSEKQIRRLRKGLEERLALPELGFAIQTVNTSVYSEQGRYLLEWTNYDTIAEIKLVPKIMAIVKEEVSRATKLFAVDVHINEQKGLWRVLAEVVGSQAPEPEQVAAIQTAVASRFPHPVDVYLWYKHQYVIGPQGSTSYKGLTDPILKQRVEWLPQVFREVIPVIDLNTE